MVDPKILTNCLHSFCGYCIHQVYVRDTGREGVMCPYCRTGTHWEDVVDDFNTAELVDVYRMMQKTEKTKPSGDLQRDLQRDPQTETYTRRDQEASFKKELNVLKNKITQRLSRRKQVNSEYKKGFSCAIQNRKRRWCEAFDRAAEVMEKAAAVSIADDPEKADLETLLRDIATAETAVEQQQRHAPGDDDGDGEEASVDYSARLHHKLLELFHRTPRASLPPLRKYLAMYDVSSIDFDAAALALMGPHSELEPAQETSNASTALDLVNASQAVSIKFIQIV